MSKHYTKKQHYIPRMILKHHTIKRPPFRNNLIYQFDKEENIKRIVDIYGICRKNNLYEFRNPDRTIIESLRNLIENTFSFYESHWNSTINTILDHKKLGDIDRALLYLLVALQILRLPDILKVEVQYCKEQLKNSGQQFADTDVENMLKLISFPTGLITDKQALLRLFLERLSRKEIIIRCTDEVLAINGDIPIVVYSDIFDCDYPITPHICLQLREKRKCKNYVSLSEDEVRELNDHTINDNGNFIYSSIPFDQILK